MKLLSVRILFFLIYLFVLPIKSHESTTGSKITTVKTNQLPIKKPNLIEYGVVIAMIKVESSDNDSAYNSVEDAVGCLQIRPIMVREVNRILKNKGEEQRFKLKDRWNRDKSLEMFTVWKNHHHPNSSDEMIARNWNGGANGHKKKSTEKYWEKVRRCLDGK